MQIWALNPLENHRRLVGNITMKKKSHWENRENHHETWEKIPLEKNTLLQLLMPLWVAVLLLAHLHSHPAQKQASSKFVSAISAHVIGFLVSPTSCLRLRNLRSRRPRFKKNTAWLGSVLPSHLNDFLHAKEPLTKPA